MGEQNYASDFRKLEKAGNDVEGGCLPGVKEKKDNTSCHVRPCLCIRVADKVLSKGYFTNAFCNAVVAKVQLLKIYLLLSCM